MSEEYTLAQKYKITWDGILRNANKPEKQERLKQYFKKQSKYVFIFGIYFIFFTFIKI